MDVGESTIGYVTVRVDISELRRKVWMLASSLEHAQKLMDEISQMELPVVADAAPRTEAE